MAERIIAFALGGLFCHQLELLPDPVFCGLLPLLLPAALAGAGRIGVPAAFLLGLTWTAAVAHWGLDARLPQALVGEDLVVTGEVAGVPGREGDRIRFVLIPESMEGHGGLHAWNWRGCRLRLTWYRAPAQTTLRSGDRWRIGVRLKRPRGSRNPGGFESEHRALRERTCATGYLRASPEPGRLSSGRRGLHPLRERIAARLDHHLGTLPAAGLVRALAVGLRDRVDIEQRWLMQATGTAHLMAISGLHVGLAAGAGLLLTGLLLRPFPAAFGLLPRAHWCGLGALLAAAGYAALAGFSIPTQRALFMLAAFLVAGLARRRCARWHPLVLALGAILVFDPLAVFDPATWLSFTAVAGLMWAMAPTARNRASPVSRWLSDVTRLQVVAGVVVAPVSVLCFAYQSLAAPVANLLAVPVTGLVAVPAILAGVLVDVIHPPLAGSLLRFAAHVLGVLLEVLAGLPGHDTLLVPAAGPTPVRLASAVVGVALLVSLASPGLRLLGLFWLLPLALPPPASPGPGALRLQVLDVGQGLASVVRTRTRTLVFDAGPAFGTTGDAGASIVGPSLRRDGAERVDLLVVSHHHADHAGGATGLDRTMRVDRVLGDGSRLARPVAPCVAGTDWEWDGYRFRVLHPVRDAPSGNDGSCVLHVSGPGGSVLLPADVEEAAESALVHGFGPGLAAEVLVVPHHGSRTSSSTAFLDAVMPRIAINSSGHRNRFRLPSANVIARYRARDVRLFDTACDGQVVVDLAPGRAPVVRTWRQHDIRFWHTRETGAHCHR